MDFSLSEEQEALRASVRRYSQSAWPRSGAAAPVDAAADPRHHWKKFAELGWLGVLVPADAGGIAGSALEMGLVQEEFGRCLVSEPYLTCAVASTAALCQVTNRERCVHLFQGIAAGEVVLAFAHCERGAHGDPQFVRTRATQRLGGGFVLNGHKSFVLGGPVADQYLIPAQLPSPGEGIGLFVIDRDAPGSHRRDFQTLDGRGASELLLEDVPVAAEGLLTTAGEGAQAVRAAIEYAIVGVCAEALGAMDDVVQVTAEYLKTRRAYGTTLSTFQALQHRVADMLVELEMSRSIFYRLLGAFSRPDAGARTRAVSAAKAFIGASALFVGANGVQLHGGMGMVADYVIGRHFKQLTALESLFGSSDFHWKRCAMLSFSQGTEASQASGPTGRARGGAQELMETQS